MKFYENKDAVDAAQAGSPLDIETFRQYVEKYGAERGQGYKDAMAHMLNQIYHLFYDPDYEHVGRLKISDARPIDVKNGLKELHADKILLLKEIIQVLETPDGTSTVPETNLAP